jgi:hypothetical protein
MSKLYKSLVLFSYFTYAICFFLPYLDTYIYAQEGLDALSWSGYGSLVMPHEFIGYAFFIAYSITVIGMLYFHSWSKKLFVALTVLSTFFTAIHGFEVLPPIDAVLSYLTNLADGAVIALMYLTSLGKRFSEST